MIVNLVESIEDGVAHGDLGYLFDGMSLGQEYWIVHGSLLGS